MRKGIARNASVRRISTSSTQPPMVPETSPITVPSARPSAVPSVASEMTIHPPASVRLNTSRPSWSVPKGCANDGPASGGPAIIWSCA